MSTFRVRVPILRNWENPAEVFIRKDDELFRDYTFPIVEDLNTFIYPEYLKNHNQAGVNIAVSFFIYNHYLCSIFELLRIPPQNYPRGLSPRLAPNNFDSSAFTIVGLSETVPEF